MKELELLQDPNFREKVRIAESVVEDHPDHLQGKLRLSMMASMTREQWIVYNAALAQDRADRCKMGPADRSENLSNAIQLAGLEYDAASEEDR